MNSGVQNLNRRNKRGSISFSTSLALALVVLGVGFVFLTLFMGGQGETKNAVDAGALSVGKQVLDANQVSVQLSGDANQQLYSDCCCDTSSPTLLGDNKIDLRRINRVWAKAMVIAINAAAAGGDAGSGTSNAEDALQGATAISNGLHDKLTTPSNLYSFFDDFAQQNSVRMLGLSATVQELPGANWQTSLLERNSESNIVLPGNPNNNFNLPANYSIPGSFATQCTRTPVPQGGSQLWFLQGYTPIQIGNQTFWQVPFEYDEKPHLVSKSTFDSLQQSSQPITWSEPVPNSFSVEGKAIPKSGTGQRALSCVFTNPRQLFTLSIPHSFLHIHVDDMNSYWYFFPTGYPPIKNPVQPDMTYGYTPETQTGVPMPAGGILCSTVTPDDVEMGLDVVGRPLDQIIFGIPQGDTKDLETNMVNRINEMVGQAGVSKSASDLHSLLSNPATIGWLISGERDFYIFSPDGQNLSVQPESIAEVQAPWLLNMISQNPDGNETEPVNDASSPAPIFFTPIVTPDPYCSPFLELGWATWEKDLHWTPGSGYNGCLGLVRVTRYTDVYSLGACNPA